MRCAPRFRCSDTGRHDFDRHVAEGVGGEESGGAAAFPAPELGRDESNPFDRPAGKVFVGREREMCELRTGLEDTLAGKGRLLFLAGEPGIGKTRCAEELCVYARRRGVEVLVGRCYEGEGAPAFWPWVQILRAHICERETAGLSAEMGSSAADIAHVVPELREKLPVPLPAAVSEPAEARFRLFDGITRFLKNVASRQALLLVLDDLNWADKPSLVLLQFIAREITHARVLVVGTYRDDEVRRHHPLFQTLGGLAHESTCRRLVLSGLSKREVARYVELSTGWKPPEGLVARVSSATEGNPFFVGEVVRLLVTEGRLEQLALASAWRLKLPEGVREAVSRRLDHLSSDCRRILALASVIGRDFRLEPLAGLSGLPHAGLLELLEEAAAARLVSEAPGALGSYRFSHALIRETLYEELPFTHRVSIHREIGQALEALNVANLEPPAAELAYHFFEAARGGGDLDNAINFARRAGERAAALLAYEDAAGHFERALITLEAKDPGDSVVRCDLLLALGEVQNSAGDRDLACETFLRAAEIARRLGAPDRLAVAALGLGPGFLGFEFGVLDEALVGLLEEALTAFPDRNSPLRARLLSSLSMALYWSQARPRTAELSEEAVEIARGVGHPAALAVALHSRHWALWGAQDARERLTSAAEIIRLAAEAGDAAMALTGRAWRLTSLLEVGVAAAVDAEIEEIARLEGQVRQPRFLWLSTLWRGMRALLGGRFEEADLLARQVLWMAPHAQDRAAAHGIEQAFGVQMLILLREKARLQELEPTLKGFVGRYPTVPAWRCALAWLYAELGREAEARDEFEHLVEHLLHIPRDLNWLVAMALLAETCASLHDGERAALLYELLLPHADRCIVVSFAVACLGSVSRYLGLLAGTMARWEEAAWHFARGIELDGRLGAAPWVAHGQREYARVLLARGEPGDRERALELLSTALKTASELGARGLTEKALALRRRVEHGLAANTCTAIDAVARLLYRSPPDLSSYAGPDGTITILFTDIEGFGVLTERLGGERAQGVLRVHNAIVREQAAAHRGVEVGCERDGFVVAFARAEKALACAVAIQHALVAYNARHPMEPLRARIGLDTGKATSGVVPFLEGTMMPAARIAAQARGGDILVSSLLHERAAALISLDFATHDPVRQGEPSAHGSYLVRWAAAPPPREVLAPTGENVFRREGEYWTLVFAGTVCRLRDSKGLRHIGYLLRHPGRAFTAHELVTAESYEESETSGTVAGGGYGLGDAGAVLDAKAKADYRRRLGELREELAEAEAFNDLGRVEKLTAEIEVLTAQLAAAVGLGGRDRKAASAAERARLTVTKRIKDALSKICAKHPLLGQHLASVIKTGYHCTYTADPPGRTTYDRKLWMVERVTPAV